MLDYHALIPTAKSGPTQTAYQQAMMKCNEANSVAGALSSEWCGLVQKVKSCASSLRSEKFDGGTFWASAAEVAKITAHPTVDCPAK